MTPLTPFALLLALSPACAGNEPPEPEPEPTQERA